MQPREVVVLHAVGDHRGRNRPVHPHGHLEPQVHDVGKCRLQATADRRADVIGEAVRQLKGHQHPVASNERDNAETVRRGDCHGQGHERQHTGEHLF